MVSVLAYDLQEITKVYSAALFAMLLKQFCKICWELLELFCSQTDVLSHALPGRGHPIKLPAQHFNVGHTDFLLKLRAHLTPLSSKHKALRGLAQACNEKLLVPRRHFLSLYRCNEEQ